MGSESEGRGRPKMGSPDQVETWWDPLGGMRCPSRGDRKEQSAGQAGLRKGRCQEKQAENSDRKNEIHKTEDSRCELRA